MTFSKIRSGVFLSLLILTAAPFVQAAQIDSFDGPIASAMGGAGRAAFDPGESAYINPASLSALRSYFGSVYYASEAHPLYGHGSHYGALLSDGNQDGLFAGALGYTHNTISAPNGHDSSEDFFLAASGYIIPNVSLALSGHYVMDTLVTGNRKNQINGSAGLMWSLSHALSLGLVGTNLAGSKDGVPDRDQLIPAYGGGLTYFWQKAVQYRLDAEYPDQLNPHHRPNMMTGFESFVTTAFALRAGFRWQESDAQEQRLMCLGLGYHSPKLSLDYAFQKDLLVAGGTRHVVDLWMPF